MARDRARSSFTVEVRRGRSTPIETDPKRSLWRGLDLAGEAARHDGVPQAAAAQAAPPPRAAVAPQARDLFAARPAAPLREAPRILPSLMQAPALVEEAPEPAREEKLPRVRRVRQRAVAAVQPIYEPDPDEVFDDAEEADEVAPVAQETTEAVAGETIRLRRRAPRGERVLRAGERWKRRLPRALW
jgi:hypothetical protein